MKPYLRPLTKRNIAVLSWVTSFINNNGKSPTVREICEGVGISTASSVRRHLDCLEAKGYIVRQYGQARSIRLTEREVTTEDF